MLWCEELNCQEELWYVSAIVPIFRDSNESKGARLYLFQQVMLISVVGKLTRMLQQDYLALCETVSCSDEQTEQSLDCVAEVPSVKP